MSEIKYVGICSHCKGAVVNSSGRVHCSSCNGQPARSPIVEIAPPVDTKRLLLETPNN